MLTIETFDNEIYEFNLPENKEQKLIDLWQEVINKSICLTTKDNKKITIKLSEITDCYIGKKEKNINDCFNFLKDMLFKDKK
jgi:hypothetical protein